MAASASGLSGAMLFAIGGEIVAFVGGHAGSEADKRRRHPGGVDRAITGAEALGLLVGIGIWGGADLQVAAGGGIAGLVAAGSVTSNGAAIGIYNAFLSSGLALSHSSRSRRACGPTAASASAPRCSIRSARMALRPMPTSPASLPRPSEPARFRPAR